MGGRSSIAFKTNYVNNRLLAGILKGYLTHTPVQNNEVHLSKCCIYWFQISVYIYIYIYIYIITHGIKPDNEGDIRGGERVPPRFWKLQICAVSRPSHFVNWTIPLTGHRCEWRDLESSSVPNQLLKSPSFFKMFYYSALSIAQIILQPVTDKRMNI